MVTVFEQGDIVYLDFDPQSGHEQKGRRPALVVSNNLFNRVSSMTMVCPITNTDRGHPFHIRLDARTRTTGVVMCDQVRMLALNTRHASAAVARPAVGRLRQRLAEGQTERVGEDLPRIQFFNCSLTNWF